MAENDKIIQEFTSGEYKEGFVTDVEQEFVPKGLNEDIIRTISRLKEEPDWLLEFRLDAFRKWQAMEMPRWPHLDLPEIDFQDIIYYAAPKKDKDRPKEIDPKLAETFEKLGIPLKERDVLAGVVAVDAVFDSVSVTTTFRKTLAEKGIIFCSFSEAVKEHPDLVRKYLATVVPSGDNYFAAFETDLNNCPDLFPIVAVLAAFCPGESRIRGVERLRHKETDRAAAIVDMLTQMGVPVQVDEDEMTIEGMALPQRLLTGNLLKGGRYTSHADHRMVMALKVAALGADGPVDIDDTACVAKSFPGFNDLFDKL